MLSLSRIAVAALWQEAAVIICAAAVEAVTAVVTSSAINTTAERGVKSILVTVFNITMSTRREVKGSEWLCTAMMSRFFVARTLSAIGMMVELWSW